MNETGEVLQDGWFIALLIGLLLATAMFHAAPQFARSEPLAYDAGVRLTPRAAGEARNIAITAIDESGIEPLGRWLWIRHLLAERIKHLAEVPPKAIGLLLPLSELQTDPGLAYIHKRRARLERASAVTRPPAVFDELRAIAQQEDKALDAEEAPARAPLRVPTSLNLPMHFKLGNPPVRPEVPLPEFERRQRFDGIIACPMGSGQNSARTQLAAFPFAAFGESAAGIEHLKLLADSDGRMRRAVLAGKYDGEYCPALLDLKPSGMALALGRGVRLGKRYIETDGQLRLHHGFCPHAEHQAPFTVYLFHDVLTQQKVPASVFRDKLVVIGVTAPRSGERPTLGRYDVIKKLGKGTMGAVYLGREPKQNRPVAIKTLALSQEFETADLDQVKVRFFHVAEATGRLNHPHIVTIYGVGEERDLAYMAMEYQHGKNLTHYLVDDKPLPLAWVLNIGIRVADALDCAHKNGVVHRDIKPANLMYNEDDTLKITDFGIARIPAASRSRTGVLLGTPPYMSPEQRTGKRVDGRSHLFSLGVMSFELVTGRQPFTGDSLATVMSQIANERHPGILPLRPHTPPCLGMVIHRALHKDSNRRRYARGEDRRADLALCLRRIAPTATQEDKRA